jgi:hypothetical protein
MSLPSRCLTVEELQDVLLGASTPLDDGAGLDATSLAELAEGWQVELIGTTYFLTQIVLRHRAEFEQLLRIFGSLSDRMWFTAEECDVNLIDYLLRNQREHSLSLQDDLIQCVENMRDYRYEKTVRM